MSLALAYITGVLSLLFAASLLDQYLTKRQPYHLLWFIAFVLFSMAMGLGFLRETFGLNQWFYRLWFLSGNTLTAAFLGTGVLYLIAPRKVANAFLGYLLVATVVAVVLVLSASIRTPEECLAGLKNLECLEPHLTLTKADYLPPWVGLLAATLNYYGGVAVLIAAVWSVAVLVRAEKARVGAEIEGESFLVAARKRVARDLSVSYRNAILAGRLIWQNRDFWRRKLPAARAAFTIIMTLGLVLAALGATLNSIDSSAAHLGFFLAGVLVIFGGLLASREIFETLPHDQLRESFQSLRIGGLGRLPIPAQLGSRFPFRRTRGDGSE